MQLKCDLKKLIIAINVIKKLIINNRKYIHITTSLHTTPVSSNRFLSALSMT